MTDNFLIQTRQLRREFGSVVAVRDVNLNIPRGAVTALIGRNGAGKTTLLKMISALLEPTRGTAVVAGINVQDKPREVHSAVGFLPDFFGLYEDLTVEEYLDFFGRAYRMGPFARKTMIDRILNQIKLTDKKYARIETLSRGMRQKVAIARTLVHNPALLLLDEPAAGLDPEARYEMQGLFKQLAEQGKTLIVSSHILTELEDYCTYVAILQEGSLVASGPVEQVRQSLTGLKRVRVKFASAPGQAVKLFESHEKISQITTQEKSLSFSFSGDDAGLSTFLKTLIEAGAPIVFFEEEQGTLQDSYLALLDKRKN